MGWVIEGEFTATIIAGVTALASGITGINSVNSVTVNMVISTAIANETTTSITE